MNERDIDVPGLRIHVLEAGSGPDLVLLHGGLATAEMMWGNRLADLATRYHVVAPDSRGHGKTRNPEPTLSYARMADDVAALIDALGLERPLILGYSDGAQIALEFALRHPGRAKALVLGGVVSEPHPVYLAGLAEWGFTAPPDLEAIQKSFGDEFYRQTQLAHGLAAADWPDYLGQISALWNGVPHYTDEQLQTIADPVLIALGDRDHMAGIDQALRLQRLIRNSELAVIPNGDHGVASGDLFWATVEDFLARHAGQ